MYWGTIHVHINTVFFTYTVSVLDKFLPLYFANLHASASLFIKMADSPVDYYGIYKHAWLEIEVRCALAADNGMQFLAENHVFDAMLMSVDSTFFTVTAVSAEYISYFNQPKISIRSFFRC